jgi:hypothetical protein
MLSRILLAAAEEDAEEISLINCLLSDHLTLETAQSMAVCK